MSSKAQKNRPRLGRGLSSLIHVSEPLPQTAPHAAVPPSVPPVSPAIPVAPSAPAGQPLEIPLDIITPNPHQPRRSFDETKIAELAASLKASGLIQPIIVRKQGDHYQLIAGERRWRAAKLAGLATIPAVIREVDSFTQAQMALIENIQREDLNPIDRALGYRTLIDQLGLTQAELAGRLGEDRSGIANYLRLLELTEPVKEMVRDGRITFGHAKLIASVTDILEQQRLADLVVAQGLSVRNLERVLQHGPTPSAPRQESTPSAHILDLEKSLTRQLGMRVQVRSSARAKGKGRLIIHYASLDQFDDLLTRLGTQAE